MSMYALPAFRAFVKPADQPAQTRCELKAWGMSLGLEGGPPQVAYIEVTSTHAYETVVRPAMRNQRPLQIGIEFADGKRLLLTGKVSPQIPTIRGMQVLEKFRMLVDRVDHSPRKRRARHPVAK